MILDKSKRSELRANLVCKAHDALFKTKNGSHVNLTYAKDLLDLFAGIKAMTFALTDKYLYVGETGIGAKDWLSKHALHW